MAIRRDAARLRGLFEIEYVLRRTAASHDPTRLGLSFSADDLPRPLEEASGRSSGVASLPLQLRKAPQGVKVRCQDEDTSDASWPGHPTVEVKGDLPVDDVSMGSDKVRSGQSIVLVVVDETPMPLAA